MEQQARLSMYVSNWGKQTESRGSFLYKRYGGPEKPKEVVGVVAAVIDIYI